MLQNSFFVYLNLSACFQVSMFVLVQVKLTDKLVDFGLSSQEGLLGLFLFVSNLLFQLLLSVLVVQQLQKKMHNFNCCSERVLKVMNNIIGPGQQQKHS